METLNKNKESGFGMLQVIMAGTMMSILSLGMASLISSQGEQISYMEDRMSHSTLKRDIYNVIGVDAENCSASLTGVNLTADGVDNIQLRDDDGNVLYDAADPDRNHLDRLNISSIRVEDVDVISGGTGSGEIRIIIQPTRTRTGGGPPDLSPIEITQRVTVDTTAGNEITGCLGGASDIPACVYRDLVPRAAGSGPGGRVGSFAMPADTVAVKLSLPAISYTGQNRNGDSVACTNSAVDLTIYPGETMLGASVAPASAVLRVTYGTVGSETYNRSNGDRVTRGVTGYRYYYGTHIILTVRNDGVTTSCGSVSVPFGNLAASNTPPLCGLASRTMAGLPENLGFELFKSEE